MDNNFLSGLFGGNSDGSGLDMGGLDINKLLVIILLLLGKLEIEVIHVYRNDFAVTLGTFNNNLI